MDVIGGGEFAYAQVRMQARLGARLDDAAWNALQAHVEFRAFLEQARSTALAPWLTSLAATADAHEIERTLSRHLHARIEEAARWMPRRWGDALRWCSQLLDLPARDHLLHGRETWPWMLEDAALAALAESDAHARAGAPLDPGRHKAPAGDQTRSLRDDWLAGWRARWPGAAPAQRRRLERLAAMLCAHLDALAEGPTHRAHSGRRARRVLEERVLRLFRHAFMEPAAAFAFLVLAALEFEQLRGALVSRAMFAGARR